MVSFQFSLKEPERKAMGGIGGAIGIKEKAVGAARPIELGHLAPGHPQITIGSSNRVGARLNVGIELEERRSELDSMFAFPDFARLPKVVPTRVGAAASEV
jgi:hypothetical protein